MRLILKLLSILIVCVLIDAQERDDSGDRQSVQQFQRPTFLDNNPIRRLVGRVENRVKQGSSLVREGSTRVVKGFQSIISDVRQRSEQLEQSFKDQMLKLRPQVGQAIKRLKALEEEKQQINQQIKVVNNTFNEKKQEYKNGLQEQKDIIDNQIRTTEIKDPNVNTELKTESEKLNKKIADANDLVLVPQPRGLGDGYGRHLK